MKNPMLLEIAEGQKAKLDANMQEAFERIVLTGMDFLYKSPQSSDAAMKTIKRAKNKPLAIGEGVAKVMVMLSAKSRGTMPWEAGVLAGYALVCDGLDFAEQKGWLRVDERMADEAMQAYGHRLMNLMNISNEKVHQMTAMAQQKAKDPKFREAYKKKTGQEIAL